MTMNTTQQQEPILIPIIQSNHRTIPEWALLELNGDLLLPHELPCENNDTLELGSLQLKKLSSPNNNDDTNDISKIVLICGTHELQGKMEALKQPFVVLQRSNNNNEECTIQGVITHKLLFNRYPKTILS